MTSFNDEITLATSALRKAIDAYAIKSSYTFGQAEFNSDEEKVQTHIRIPTNHGIGAKVTTTM